MDANKILADPSAFGVSFDMSPVSKKEGPVKVELKTVPILVIVDVDKFRATVENADNIIAVHLNGSSVRVHAQGIARDAVLKKRTISDVELKTLQVNGILNAIRMVRQAGPKTWKTPAGTFTDRTAAVAETSAWFVDNAAMEGEVALSTAEKVVAAQD